MISLVPRPPPSFPSRVVRKSGRGPGTFPHVSDVTDRANYVNVGDMYCKCRLCTVNVTDRANYGNEAIL